MTGIEYFYGLFTLAPPAV